MAEEPGPETLFELLDDEHARRILAVTTPRQMSASELIDELEASRATVYRRIDQLKQHNLLAEDMQFDPDGNHYKVYRATVDHIDVDITGDGIETSLEIREDVADRFTRVWEGIKQG